MNRQQEFRKQTEEAKLEAFSLMCKKVAELEAENEQIKNSDTLCKLIGEQKRKIAELEAEVKEWKDKADLWCKTANLKDHNIMINKELEKENAALKGQMSLHEGLLWNDLHKLEKENAELKELVKNIIRVTWGEGWNYSLDWKVKAEQFLKGGTMTIYEDIWCQEAYDRGFKEGREFEKGKLTKAKELLTRFLMASVYFNGKEADLIKEAEQFLNSEVEKCGQ